MNNNTTFEGKVALVTGGTSGIGKTTAIAFARAGAKVVLTGRREKEGAQVVAEIKKLGGGAIVNTSSVAGHVGMGQVSIYTASKHAVEGLTKALALEFAKQNIRINAVAPAGVATDMVDRFAGKEGEMRDYLTSLHPVGRIGTSEEIAAAVLYLCSDDAKFTTGTSLVVDGGMLAQ